jgi:hypothetical protein
MGELGDFFELVVTGPLRVNALFAECRQSFTPGAGTRYRVWWSRPGNVREEGYDESGKPVSIYVESGSHWWRWLSRDARGAVTNTLGDPKERANSNAAWMLRSHARLAVVADAQIEGHEPVAGREAILVQLPERQIAVDAEYGVTLRSTYRGDVLFEVEQIEFDVRVPAERFEFTRPAGVELRAASSDRPPPQPVEDISAAVSFRVFEPGPIELAWPVDANAYLGRRDRPDSVSIRLRAAPIWISQSPAADPESFGSRFLAPEEWSRLVRDGVELEVREAPSVVRLVREGTHIEVYGDAASLEELITIALALRPVTAPTPSRD